MDLCEMAVNEGGDAQRHPWEITRQEFILDSVARLPGRGKVRRILDLGCGDVFISKQLARAYPEVRLDAVDPAFTSQAIKGLMAGECPANLHLAPSLDDLRADDEPVGLVLLLDVLEHVKEDGAFLENLARLPLIAPDAHFLITVPAFPSLFCSHDRLLGHYRRYTLDLIRETAAGAGLSTAESGYAYLSGFWVRAARTALEKWHLVKPLGQTEITDWKQGTTVTNLVNTMLRGDLRLSTWLARYRIRIPGLSCYIFCRRAA